MNLFFRIDDLINLPWSESSVAIGTFDGIHRGHQAVVRQALADASNANRAAVVFTFDRHPSEVVRPGHAPEYLSTLAERIALIEAMGVDNLVVAPFTREFSSMTAEAFAFDVLRDRLKCRHLIVGEDFRFGRDRTGSVEYLREESERFGFEVTPVAAVTEKGVRISSSNIRKLIAEGAIGEAEALLGRPYTFTGTVVGGQRLGRKLGYPTANLVSVARQLAPSNGIYAVRTRFRGQTWHGACSIGVRPAVGGTSRTIEVYLIDYPGDDFYGATMSVTFVQRLRDEWNFDTLEALKEQIARDVENAKLALFMGEPRG